MATSTELLGQLQQFQASRKKPQDILAEQEEKLGVSGVRARQAGLRGAIQNTENLLKNVDPSVTGRTSGSLVTEAQRTKMVSNERAPIADQFTEQSRALEGETANLADLSSSARTAAQLAISADDAAQSNLQSLYGFAYQREQDEIARAERERAFRLQEEEARRQAAAASAQANYLKSLFGGGSVLPANNSKTGSSSKPSKSLDDIAKSIQGNQSKGIQAPKPGWTLAGLANPAFGVYGQAAGLYASNKDNINYALNNKSKIAKQAWSGIRSLF